jgi:hypothetical protein
LHHLLTDWPVVISLSTVCRVVYTGRISSNCPALLEPPCYNEEETSVQNVDENYCKTKSGNHRYLYPNIKVLKTIEVPEVYFNTIVCPEAKFCTIKDEISSTSLLKLTSK